MEYLGLIIVDFGLLVLAWLVQLIIYPSFQYIDKAELAQWHQRYQTLISYFVIPLMFTELGLSIYIGYQSPNILSITHLTLLFFIWLSTFTQAVPVHQKIASKVSIEHNVVKLVRVNLPRTILWTICFVISIISYL